MSILNAFLQTTMNRNGMKTTRIINLKPVHVHVWNKGPKNAKKVSFQGPKNTQKLAFLGAGKREKVQEILCRSRSRETCTPENIYHLQECQLSRELHRNVQRLARTKMSRDLSTQKKIRDLHPQKCPPVRISTWSDTSMIYIVFIRE